VGRAGVLVDDSRHVPGLSADEVSQQLLAAFAALPGHRCALVQSGTCKLARSYRHRLGFLRTHTDLCTITVVEAPPGVVVTAVGRLVPAARAALDAALARPALRVAPATAPPPPRQAAPAPSIPVPPADRPSPWGPPPPPTQASPPPRPARAAPLPPPAPVPVAVATASAALRLESGQIIVLGGGVVVVGRNPSASPSDGRARLVPVPDPAGTVSKTHFACGEDARGVWVEDRRSMNGTRVTDRRGRSTMLEPGRRTRVPLDITITFADSRALLVQAP
jgi:hypothetical protein